LGVFAPSPVPGVLRQGEILTDVITFHVRNARLYQDDGEYAIEAETHPYALVLTQDCDLDWDFKARAEYPEDRRGDNKCQAKLVPNVLLCDLFTSDALRPRIAGGDIFKRVRGNQDERYHCLPAISLTEDLAGEGLPELIADFKRIFSVLTDELYGYLAQGARRRAFLQSPHLQHLSTRFGYYCLRVALPDDASGATRTDPAATVPAADQHNA